MLSAPKINGIRAKKLVEKKNAMIIDVRSPVAFRDGTLPGAVNITLRQLSAALANVPKTKPLIFFGESESDDTLKAAINYAYQFGFTNVNSLGSKDNWDK